MCLFTSSVTVSVKFSLYMMDLMIKINHEQYDKVTDAVGFRGRRPSKDGMPVEGVDFGKILALLPLKILIFLQLIPAKQGFSFTYLVKIFQRCKS